VSSFYLNNVLFIRRVWRYQSCSQRPYIEER